MPVPVHRPSRILGNDAGLKVSFEFFPPKTEAMEQTLWHSIERLAPLSPSFVSVTYGAGGSTRERTHATVARILAETPLKPAAHLTCVAATRDEVGSVVAAYRDAGVRHIVALRGDPVEGAGARYQPHPGGYANAAALVAGIAALGHFEISVAAYPERHPESPSVGADIDMLKRKVDAGATRAITQFFFDNDVFESYLDRVRAAGVGIPIVPGIVPVQNFKAVAGFAAKTGATVPSWLARRFDG
ncbi:MAG: methylenetetrahydrofolate reductase, partial [Bauldia sp.]